MEDYNHPETLRTQQGHRLAIAGMVTEEVREACRRVGFKIRDLDSGREGWLAKMEGSAGPRIGKYNVDLHDLERIGVEAIRNAIEGNRSSYLLTKWGPWTVKGTRTASWTSSATVPR